MIAYFVKYTLTKEGNVYSMGVNAKDLKSAKKKIERKEGKKIQIFDYSIIGYY